MFDSFQYINLTLLLSSSNEDFPPSFLIWMPLISPFFSFLTAQAEISNILLIEMVRMGDILAFLILGESIQSLTLSISQFEP